MREKIFALIEEVPEQAVQNVINYLTAYRKYQQEDRLEEQMLAAKKVMDDYQNALSILAKK